MVWGEIIANACIIIVGYLWIDGRFGENPS